MSTPYQLNVLRERLKLAEDQAMANAAIADHLAARLAEACNALKPHDPALVTRLTGIADKAPDATGAPSDPA